MSKEKYPVTPAIRFLREHHIAYEPHVFAYEDHGGTAQTAAELGLNEHQVIKTIVLANEAKHGLIVLMHGDREISTRNLARQLGMKHIEPATAAQASKWTGYLFGGTSPFGTKTALHQRRQTRLSGHHPPARPRRAQPANGKRRGGMSMPEILLIVAQSDNGAIGHQGAMPWHLPRDLKHFKAQTLGHPVIMGRKTYDSIGRALPGRQNLVISRNAALALPDAQTCPDLATAIARARGDKIFIIGGAEIYRLALPLADTLLVTHVHTHVATADAFFPPIDPVIWQETARETHAADDVNRYPMCFCRYERRR